MVIFEITRFTDWMSSNIFGDSIHGCLPRQRMPGNAEITWRFPMTTVKSMIALLILTTALGIGLTALALL